MSQFVVAAVQIGVPSAAAMVLAAPAATDWIRLGAVPGWRRRLSLAGAAGIAVLLVVANLGVPWRLAATVVALVLAAVAVYRKAARDAAAGTDEPDRRSGRDQKPGPPD